MVVLKRHAGCLVYGIMSHGVLSWQAFGFGTAYSTTAVDAFAVPGRRATPMGVVPALPFLSLPQPVLLLLRFLSPPLGTACPGCLTTYYTFRRERRQMPVWHFMV